MGELCVSVYRAHYAEREAEGIKGVRERLQLDYAMAVSELVWGDLKSDAVIQTFFAEFCA